MLVSDTSTLILLAKINALGPLLDEVKQVAIPKAVYAELARKEGALDVLLIKKEIGKKRITVHDVGKKHYANILEQFKLDEGEASAYGLLKQKNAEAILTDDGELIKLCKVDGVAFITALSVVVRLYRKKKLAKTEALEKL